MKQNINLSINPSYFCNFRCDFCYLSKEQLSDRTRTPLNDIQNRLNEISATKSITHVDIYGGEVALLPEDYFYDLKKLLRLNYLGPISIISNGFRLRPFMLDDDIDLTVSWDGKAREKHEYVYENLKNISKPFHILLLASPEVARWSDPEVQDYIEKLNQLPSAVSLEIKPYSYSHYNAQDKLYDEFELLVMAFMRFRQQMDFEFINEKKLRLAINSQLNAWSDDHLYITPQGQWAVLDFDAQGREYFRNIPDLTEYEAWANREKINTLINPFCSSCTYMGHCLSEHLNMVDSTETVCNGFKKLIDWYAEEHTHGRV